MEPEKKSRMTNGDRMRMPRLMPNIRKNFSSRSTCQTLLKTRRTLIISQMTIQRKASMEMSPKRPDWAVFRMLSAASIRLLIRRSLLMLA